MDAPLRRGSELLDDFAEKFHKRAVGIDADKAVTGTHPLVRRFVRNAKRKGTASVYAGRSFAVACWADGKRVELRVDEKTDATKKPNE